MTHPVPKETNKNAWHAELLEFVERGDARMLSDEQTSSGRRQIFAVLWSAELASQHLASSTIPYRTPKLVLMAWDQASTGDWACSGEFWLQEPSEVARLLTFLRRPDVEQVAELNTDGSVRVQTHH